MAVTGKAILKHLDRDIKRKRKEPLWQGPESNTDQGGITFSMLSRFLCCRERFRISYVEGLRPVRTFNHRTDYGDMWHACEEAHASKSSNVFSLLDQHVKELAYKYKMDRNHIAHWSQVCKTQFPEYVDYWSKNEDVKGRIPVYQERVFNVPYLLPSGRTVYLRGKQDACDLILNKKEKHKEGFWIQENKTKGDVRPDRIQRQLLFDLQTQMYAVAMTYIIKTGSHDLPKEYQKYKLRGVRYNVIKRPLSGGKHSISQKKPSKGNPTGESSAEFYERLKGLIHDNPQDFFMRWKVEIPEVDVNAFTTATLDPLLEQLCLWYRWITFTRTAKQDPFSNALGIHWRHPFGVLNILDEGGESELDEYLATGNEMGLELTDALFKELT